MFNSYLNAGAVRRLHSLLKDPFSFDALEFVQTNQLQLIKGASSINDLYAVAEVYEEFRRSLLPSISTLVHQLITEISLIGLRNGLSERCALPLDIEFQIPLHSSDETANVFRIDIINQQIERLFEGFDITSYKEEESDLTNEVLRAIELFLLSELLYLTFYGLTKVGCQSRRLIFTARESHFNNFFKPKWFANFWEQSSGISSMAYLNFMPEGISANEASGFIEQISISFLDKIFHVNSKHLTGRLARTDGFRMMSLVTKIIALLFHCQFKLGRSFAYFSELEDVGITQNEIEDIKAVNSSLIASDKFLKFTSNKVYITNPCVSMHSRKLIEMFTRMTKHKGFDNEIGRFFEQEYISNYVTGTLNEGADRFRVHGEILAHQVFPGNKEGDVDLIVEDTSANRFFFMQIKYIRNAGKPFLKGDVEYLTNSKIQHGIEQLKKMSEFLRQGMLDSVLNEKKISNCTTKNTTFMWPC